ncbi:hypothetical protein [Winogradskya humida]|uniref:Uncharacterized protein n=1 Tax=Winogradskya humida TaxID=113566 RepID=A0ABQ3ZHD7_9ACTN|nr:hypothetical protein [Actinoplanes humidus]GIE17957.1 hypothetical protein Ahu01nite_010590 [Actinoplanes humidus]
MGSRIPPRPAGSVQPCRRLSLAVDEGWTRDDRGAWLLRRFLATYSGSPDAFTDLTGYEAAVNGRGIPDLDLTGPSRSRAADLARRGVAFSLAALYRLNEEHPDHPAAVAYLTISAVDMDDEDVYVADITFVTVHDGEPPYVKDLEQVTTGAILAIGSAECRNPLPPAPTAPVRA